MGQMQPTVKTVQESKSKQTSKETCNNKGGNPQGGEFKKTRP